MVATVATDPEVFHGNAVPVPGLRRHVLDLDDFTAEEITATLDNAAAMRAVLARDIKKVPALRGRVIVTLFYEASTRTRISFEEAGKILSADVINMTASASSIEKGESLLNTGLTLQAMGVDVIVVRHPHAGAPHFLARNLATSPSSTPATAHTRTRPRACLTCTPPATTWADWPAARW